MLKNIYLSSFQILLKCYSKNTIITNKNTNKNMKRNYNLINNL